MPAPRPRDAATLILVRHDGARPRLLMGRRAGGHDFMPGKWVFPGGRLERGDYSLKPMADLPADVAADLAATARLARQQGARLARALAAAAVRETLEESGLLLGRMAGGRLQPDLSGLAYVARAITPPARHRRYDARFLVADAAGLADLEPVDSRELEEIAWLTLADARALDLPTVTRAVLDIVEARLQGRELPPPFWRWTRHNPLSAL